MKYSTGRCVQTLILRDKARKWQSGSRGRSVPSLRERRIHPHSGGVRLFYPITNTFPIMTPRAILEAGGKFLIGWILSFASSSTRGHNIDIISIICQSITAGSKIGIISAICGGRGVSFLYHNFVMPHVLAGSNFYTLVFVLIDDI